MSENHCNDSCSLCGFQISCEIDAGSSGKPVIVRTYEAAENTGLFDEVYVVTDSQYHF